MHVHRQPVDLGINNLYAARAAEKAAELKRAAETRRKLMKAAAGIAEEGSEFGSFLVDQRSGEGSREGGSDGQPQPSAGSSAPQPRRAERSSAAVEAGPLSVWA